MDGVIPAQVTRLEINNADELIKKLIDIKSRWPDCVFRGQSRVWNLIPGLWRDSNAAQFVQRWGAQAIGFEDRLGKKWLGDLDNHHRTLAKNLVAWIEAERLIVSHFIYYCESCALPYPKVTSHEMQAIAFSDAYGMPYPEFNSQIGFAQHYGLPTRVLDFTDHPLKALYFAIYDNELGLTPMEPFEVVCAINTGPGFKKVENYGIYRDGPTIKRALRSEIAYLHAQDGLFIDGQAAATSSYMQNGQWPGCFTEIMTGWEVVRIKCCGLQRYKVSEIINSLGINCMSMMPSPQTAAALTKFRITDSEFIG